MGLRLNTKLKLGDCLFGSMKLAKNAYPNKYGYNNCYWI